MNGPPPAAPPPKPLSLLRQDELEFGSLTPRRHRTTTWCGSFGASRPSLLSSREHLSDTDSLDSWQPPQSTDINANVAASRRSPVENESGVSALYDARSRPLNASLCKKNFLSSRENVQRSRKRHYCKDTYAERMLQHGGVFISGTENKPFLLQNIDSKGGAAASNAKTRSLPRNLGVARRRSSTSGRSRPKSMEGLSSFSTGFDAGNLASWTQNFAPLNRSKSTEEQLVPQSATDLSVAPGMSSMQQQWDASDAADYASLNSCLLGKSPTKQTRVTYEEVKSSMEENSLFPSRRIVRIDNVAKDAEVKYIKHRPLKPIHVVDAEHHRKKGWLCNFCLIDIRLILHVPFDFFQVDVLVVNNRMCCSVHILGQKKNCYVALTRPKSENWVGRSIFFFFFFFTYRERVEFSNIFLKVSKWGKLGRNAVKTHIQVLF